MSNYGPPPKRSEARIRRNAGYAEPTKAAIDHFTEPPYELDESWHPIAIAFWESLPRSGQSQFYAESDWAAAYMLCEQISREMKPQFIGMVDERDAAGDIVTRPKTMKMPMKGASLAAIRGMMTDLLVTETSRRRIQLELERAGAAGAASADPVADEVARKRQEMEEKRRRTS